MIKYLILLLLLRASLAQACPQLCSAPCTNGTCSQCYVDFPMGSAFDTTNTCACPSGYYLNTATNLCNFCPVFCLTCTSYTSCKTCIAGYQLANNYTCTKKITNAGGWTVMNISYDLTQVYGPMQMVTGLQIRINNSSTPISSGYITINNSTYFSYCSKIPTQKLFGVSQFDASTQILKSSFALPPHEWAHIKFQYVAADFWSGDGIVLQTNYYSSYKVDEMEAIRFNSTQLYNSSTRIVDFCGTPNIYDNMGIAELYLPHNNSMIKFRIRTTQFNSTSTISTKHFGIREILLRVGTCPRNCLLCSSPGSCFLCKSPYYFSSNTSSCVCNLTVGYLAANGLCFPNCLQGTMFNYSTSSCVKCQSYFPNCRTCSSTTGVYSCLSCQLGYFYGSGQCYNNCPPGYSNIRNNSYILNNIKYYQDQCVLCPSGCSLCQGSLCFLCNSGLVFSGGLCSSSCPSGTYPLSNSDQCLPCAFGCQICSSAYVCQQCVTNFGNFVLMSGICVIQCPNNQTVLNLPVQTNICGLTLTCSTSCLNCYGPNSSNCLSCSSGTYLFQFTCVASCQTSYFANNGLCQPCPVECSSCISLSNCSACAGGFYMNKGICVRKCPVLTFLNATLLSCAPCPLNCMSCQNQTSCLGCQPPSFLFNSTCWTNQSCPSKYYYDPTYLNCIKCSPFCQQCLHSLCFRCTLGYYLERGACFTNCSVGKIRTTSSMNISGNIIYYGTCKWRSPLCQTYDSNSTTGNCSTCSFFSPALVSMLDNVLGKTLCLFSCPLGFAKTSTLSCTPCPLNCRRCNQNLQCYQCLDNYVINNKALLNASNSASLNNLSCVLNYCAPPYFSDSLQCQQCPTGCYVCQIDGSCIQCLTSFKLVGSTCIDYSCTSISSFYNRASSSCQPCDTTCLSCSLSSVNCTSCPRNSTLQTYLYNGSCSSTCLSGYFNDPISLSCRACNPKCSTCTSISNCLVCVQNFYLLAFYSPLNALCVAQCPIGFYISGGASNGVCQLCYRDCKSCFGPGDFQCLTCYPNFFLDDSSCVYICSPNKFPDDQGHCDWCHESCLTCSGPADFQCVTCSANQYRYRTQCFNNSCPDATYLARVSEGICQECQFGCSVCSSPYFCSYCFAGYYLYQGWCYQPCPFGLLGTYFASTGYICGQCSTLYGSNCLNCTANQCTSCNPPSVLYSIGMTTAGSSLQYCLTSCPSGYYLRSLAESTCISCNSSCTVCSAADNCTLCASGYWLIDGLCVKNCPAGTYQSTSSAISCYTCPAVCASCLSSTNCTSCVYGAYLYFNLSSLLAMCVSQCPSQTYADVSGWCIPCSSNCLTCKASYYCTLCASGFTLSGGYCSNLTNCTTAITGCLLCSGSNCVQCSPPFFLYDHRCVTSCPVGYFSTSTNCSRCNSSCLACTNNPNNCTQCQPNLFLQGSNCVSRCPVGYTYNSTSSICIACPANCYRCNLLGCLRCRTNYSNFNGNCVNNCPAGTYKDDNSNMCLNCSRNCLTCLSQRRCLSCKSPFILFNNTCISACPPTYYVISTPVTQQCYACSSPCYTCTDSTNCTTCISNYILNGSSCQLNCPDGTYKSLSVTANGSARSERNSNDADEQHSDDSYNYNQNTNQMRYYFYQCMPCSYRCLTCVGSSNNCLQCNSQYYLYGGQCMPACPASTYLNLSSNTCSMCPQYCQICYNSTNCTVCTGGTMKLNGRCVLSCPSSSFVGYKIVDSTIAYQCILCNQPCLSCRGPTQYDCITCINGFYLVNESRCVQQCPPGYYNSSTANCFPCRQGCTACSSLTNCSSCNSATATTTNQCGNNSTLCNVTNCNICDNNGNCILCIGGFFVSNGGKSCVSSCPNGTYASPDKVCVNCTANCSVCLGPQCQTCINSTYLYQGSCVNVCPVFTKPVQGICVVDPCSTYNSTNSNCSQCSPPYSLVSVSVSGSVVTQCILSCPNSTILVQSQCLPCPVNCTTCLSPSICLICSPGTMLYEGYCVPICPLGYYINTTTSANITTSTCSPCQSAKCAKCTFNSTSSTEYCTSCLPGTATYLYNGTCVYTCPTGTYPVQQARKCIPCTSPCSACTNFTYCSSCSSTYLLYNGNCLPSCPTGTYVAAGQCLPCSSSCYSCTSYPSCTSCIPPLSALIITTPNSIITNCVSQCPAGTYSSVTASSYSNSNSNICLPCVQPCLTCNGPSSSNCLSCIPTYSLLVSSFTCVVNCPAGYYSAFSSTIDLANYSSNSTTPSSYSTTYCNECDPTCLTCINSSSICLTCFNGYHLDSHYTCVSNCSARGVYSNNGSCFNCSSQCYSCYGPSSSNCLSCLAPLLLYSSSCVSVCPTGYFATSTYQCNQCDLTVCISCSVSQENCTLCQLGLVMQAGKCQSSCSLGFYLVNGQCISCDQSCQTCNGPASTNCLTCNQSLLLYYNSATSTCVLVCPANTTSFIDPATSNKLCQPCPSNCLSCTQSSTTTNCTQCIPQMYLLKGICLPACPVTYVGSTQSSLSQCIPCSSFVSNCYSCFLNSTNQVQCQQCITPYLLVSDSMLCVTQCPTGYSLLAGICTQIPACQGFLYIGFCLNVCPAGTYPNSTTTCNQCPSLCSSCTSSTNCQTCVSPSSLLISTTSAQCISQCPTGYYSLNGVCTACNSPCNACMLDTTNTYICISCPSGYSMLNGQCLAACPNGYYSASAQCQPCMIVCSTCSASSSCTLCKNTMMTPPSCSNSTCNSTSYMAANGCAPCTSPCLSCYGSQSYQCLSCSSPLLLISGQCRSSCPQGYVSNSISCIPCPSQCSTCTISSGTTQCVSCNSPYLLSPMNTCVLSCQLLNTGSISYYQVNSSCYSCASNCSSCSASSSSSYCSACYSPLFLYNNSCTPSCPATTFAMNSICYSCGTNCKYCTSTTNCTQCMLNFYLYNANCVPQCPSSTYANSNSACTNCSSHCSICTSSGCSSCTSPYSLVNGSCSACQSGFYFVSSSSMCQPCSSACLTCSTTSTNCTACSSSTYLLSSNCVQQCPTGYTYASVSTNYTLSNGTIISTSTSICIPCKAGCATCNSSNSSQCYSCLGTYFTYVTSSTQCVTTCPNATYADSNMNCLNCSTNCTSCSSSTSCLKCASPNYLFSGYCINQCPTGYAPSASTCAPCLSGCKQCNPLSNCILCDTNLTPNTNGSCSPNNSCPSGQYLSNTQCQPCYSTCLTCSNGGPGDCLSCPNITILVNGACQTISCNSTSYFNTTTNTCQQCAIGSFLSSGTCSLCSTNCNYCSSSVNCSQCAQNYYLQSANTGFTCTNQCPDGFYNPTTTDGTGVCLLCPYACLKCIDSSKCTVCSKPNFVISNGKCIPQNCLNCISCDMTNQICLNCTSPYLLYQSGCVLTCPTGFYANTTTRSCDACIQNCLVCPDSLNCTTCITNYVFTAGGGCQDWSVMTYGQVANISGFTSNITAVVAAVYVSTSAGPIAFGEMTSTYFNIEFCQFLYFHGSSSAGNSQMQNFLNSLQTVSLTSGSTANTTQQSSKRMLTASQYTSSFLATNAIIFAMMVGFLAAFIAVTLFQRYIDHCCVSCGKLHFYLTQICVFIHKRFKWIYFDFIMWTSYLPFLYFSFLQLQNMKFDSFINGFSSLLAVVIIGAYPLYPAFICYLLKKDYTDICYGTNTLTEMSLSPFIYKVPRPQIVQDQNEFRYFTKQNIVLAYYPLKYVRKFVFVAIVALCPVPTTTLITLIVINVAFIIYMFVFKPRLMPYLIVDLIIEFVLLFFEVFMLAYIVMNGSQVAVMSIITHAIGFIMANVSLIAAIVLNLIAYYKIFCCIYDLYKHLKEKAEEKEKGMLKDQVISENQHEFQPEFIEKIEDQKELNGKRKVNDDSMTQEDASQKYSQMDMDLMHKLDDKELIFNGIDPSKLSKSKKIMQAKKEEVDDQIPQLKQSSHISKVKEERKKKREDRNKDKTEESSDVMGNSKLSSEEGYLIEDGLLKNKVENKFKRQIGVTKVEEGVLKDVTRDKYKRNHLEKINSLHDQEHAHETSSANLVIQERPKKAEQDKKVQDGNFNSPEKRKNSTEIRKGNQIKEGSNIEDLTLIERLPKLGEQDQIEDLKLKLRDRDQKSSRQPKSLNQPNIEDANLKQKQPKSNKQLKQVKKEIPDGKIVDRAAKQKKKQGIQDFTAPDKLVPKVYNDPFDEAFFKEEKSIPQARMNERTTNPKSQAQEDVNIQGNAVEVKRVKPKSKFYKGSDDEKEDDKEQIAEGKIKEVKHDKYRRNLNRQKHTNEEQQMDIEGQVKDITTKKKAFNNLVSQENMINEVGTYDHKGKKNQRDSTDQLIKKEEIEDADLYDYKGKKHQKDSTDQLLQKKEIEDANLYEHKGNKKDRSMKPEPNQGGFFNNLMNQEVAESIVIKKGRNQMDESEFQQDNAENRKRKHEQKKKNKDRLLQMSEPIDESYEQMKRNNKINVIKAEGVKKGSLQMGQNDQFEEVSYVRGESKIEKRSRSRDRGLGINDSEASDSQDVGKDARRNRNSAIQRLRKKGNLQVDQKMSEDSEDTNPMDSRRESKIIKAKAKKNGILKIEQGANDDGLDSIQL